MAPKIYTERLSNGVAFDMILVEGGSFLMGADDVEAFDWEKPVHQVDVHTFYLGQFLVTQALWKAVMGEGTNPSGFNGERLPVETVSWDDAQDFIQKLNAATEESRRKYYLDPYRLPSESEWEFAARGGVNSEGYLYPGSDKLKEVGWYNQNSNNKTQDVGLLMGNELGLYDLSGNVNEWTDDDWHDNYEGAPKDGSSWLNSAASSNRVVRGGQFYSEARSCRISYRTLDLSSARYEGLGFRIAFSLNTDGQLDQTI